MTSIWTNNKKQWDCLNCHLKIYVIHVKEPQITGPTNCTKQLRSFRLLRCTRQRSIGRTRHWWTEHNRKTTTHKSMRQTISHIHTWSILFALPHFFKNHIFSYGPILFLFRSARSDEQRQRRQQHRPQRGETQNLWWGGRNVAFPGSELRAVGLEIKRQRV